MTDKPKLPWADTPVWRSVDCGEGWWPIIAELDEDLRRIYPDYRVVQVKEKFGSLCYYTDAVPEDLRLEFYARIGLAAQACDRTCELCGALGRLRDDRPWLRTLCDEDAARAPR